MISPQNRKVKRGYEYSPEIIVGDDDEII